MKMMRIIHLAVVGTLVGALSFAWATENTSGQQADVPPAQQPTPARPDTWETAGQEVKGAAGAVAEATRETTGSAWDALKSESAGMWEKTKSGSQELYNTVGERSKEAWHTTKEESQGLWQKGKSMIHEATAPEPPPSPVQPQTEIPASSPPPAATPPVQH